MMEKIKDYFKRYPQSDEVYENDGVLFHNIGAAESYGTGKTTRYTRKDVEAPQSQEGGASDEPDADEAVKAEMEKLKTADISALDYNEIKRLVTLFKLAADDNKKDTLISVLTELKNNLNAE